MNTCVSLLVEIERSRARETDQLSPLEIGVERRGGVSSLHRAEVVHKHEEDLGVVDVLAVRKKLTRQHSSKRTRRAQVQKRDRDNARDEQLVVESLFELRHAQLDVEESILVEEVVHAVGLEDVCVQFDDLNSSAYHLRKEDEIPVRNAPDRDSILPAFESSVCVAQPQ